MIVKYKYFPKINVCSTTKIDVFVFNYGQMLNSISVINLEERQPDTYCDETKHIL